MDDNKMSRDDDLRGRSRIGVVWDSKPWSAASLPLLCPQCFTNRAASALFKDMCPHVAMWVDQLVAERIRTAPCRWREVWLPFLMGFVCASALAAACWPMGAQ